MNHLLVCLMISNLPKMWCQNLKGQSTKNKYFSYRQSLMGWIIHWPLVNVGYYNSNILLAIMTNPQGTARGMLDSNLYSLKKCGQSHYLSPTAAHNKDRDLPGEDIHQSWEIQV